MWSVEAAVLLISTARIILTTCGALNSSAILHIEAGSPDLQVEATLRETDTAKGR